MMKKLFIFMLFLLTTSLWAQSSGFNYKALITNNGTVLATQTVDVKFTLLDGTSTAVYEETNVTTTDANGIVSILLGEGTVVLGDFTTIDWANSYSLKVEIDTQDGSGYQDFGTNPFKYVPYAKYAEKAGNVFSGDYSDLTNVPADLADGDDDTQLTEAQVDVMVANNGYLTSEVDGSVTNELQNLVLQNDTLRISNGNHVVFANWDTDVSDDFDGSFNSLTNVPADLADGDDDTQLTEAQVDAMVANNGYLTSEVDGSVSNELQTVTFDNGSRVLTISNGNSVTIPASSATSGDGWGTQVVETGVGLTGNGTNISPLSVNLTDVVEINDLSDARTIDHSIYLGTGSGLHDDGSDNRNTAIGYRAMDSIATGSSNVAIGFEALFSNKAQFDNVAIGDRSLYKNYGRGNTALGFNALYESINGSKNVAIGRNAGRNNQGSSNVFIGYHAAYYETGSNKLYIDNTSTSSPLIYGDFSTNELKINGNLAIKDGTQGVGKVFTSDVNGKGSWEMLALQLQNDTLSIDNGNQVIFSNWDTNVSDDVQRLNDLSDAKNDGRAIFIGNNAGLNIANAISNNVGIGTRSLQDATTAEKNVAIGFEAMMENITGTRNVAVGDRAIFQNRESQNTAIGFNTLYSNINGNNNVALGHEAGYLNTGSDNIFIGNEAGYNETGSDKLYIDNTNTSDPLIYGDFANNFIKINGELHGQDSGDADMKAYIYGSIDSGGAIASTATSSDGFTVNRISTGKYKVTFNQSPVSAHNYTVIASMNYGFLGFISVVNHGTYFEVRTYDTAATISDESFNFVVYKK